MLEWATGPRVVTMHTTDIVRALIGGVMIGTACCAMLYFSGRIAGISGIAGGWMDWREGEVAWRGAFLLGLAAGAFALLPFFHAAFDSAPSASLSRLAAAGLLVGFGTRLGNGCTSGHGVCGISRMSLRSLVATCTFIASAALVVFLTRIGAAR